MTAPQPGETVLQRYRREAKARLADRVGEDLAEEFFSVAQTTDRDVVNVAELMAAAYKRGLEARARVTGGEEDPACEESPVYAKVPQEGTSDQWAVTWDEGWRSGVLCEGMYEHDADLVLRALGRRPRRA